MKSKKYYTIGVMSGTSLDGIDLCYVNFYRNEFWHYEILKCETVLYDYNLEKNLKKSINISDEELRVLDIEYSKYLSKTINDFIVQNEISDLDLICSHGHTVFHEPDRGITYQIGNLPELKTYLNSTIVCDFRVQDVKLGGQGAPLVPIGDELLFNDFDFCLNLGGFSNISFKKNNDRIAFDICPVNIVLNHYVNRLNKPFDEDGEIARTGNLNLELLERLNNIEFYKLKPPKSLGLEWVNENIFPLIDDFHLPIKDVLRTMVEHIAVQIVKVCNQKSNSKILVTGGGAFNKFLISRIQKLSLNQIVTPNDDIINYKEALIFAFLGVLRVRNEVNCLSSVTGASRDHSSGKIY